MECNLCTAEKNPETESGLDSFGTQASQLVWSLYTINWASNPHFGSQENFKIVVSSLINQLELHCDSFLSTAMFILHYLYLGIFFIPNHLKDPCFLYFHKY